MAPVSATLSHESAAVHADKRSLLNSPVAWLASLVEALRRDAADRRLRDQLADMDDAMLRDIGVADDEMHKIRARDSFTPRAWAARGAGPSRYEF